MCLEITFRFRAEDITMTSTIAGDMKGRDTAVTTDQPIDTEADPLGSMFFASVPTVPWINSAPHTSKLSLRPAAGSQDLRGLRANAANDYISYGVSSSRISSSQPRVLSGFGDWDRHRCSVFGTVVDVVVAVCNPPKFEANDPSSSLFVV
ncbi:hypothetical protein BO70DRAFT_393457 [Aspergillus heteromorphus CBS 117.55]|uniref:Uncharacterized protein n=1 Tax=Aspergillus heteromorphus CBS 117.55 TaxID=1448321 RepID=A0A317WXG8_9EURO|nr:uncharacterized protein BO70DRAFT_393457 [Aspergillus heteromorphus CBS 117.55]PWY88940.1 hypothetical protein BO70DRAFT_393457 [Aspergillus heteromorphus CBS 117.55]